MSDHFAKDAQLTIKYIDTSRSSTTLSKIKDCLETVSVDWDSKPSYEVYVGLFDAGCTVHGGVNELASYFGNIMKYIELTIRNPSNSTEAVKSKRGDRGRFVSRYIEKMKAPSSNL